MRSACAAALAVILASATGAAAAAEPAAASARISLIEHALTPKVQVEGRPQAPMTLAELMRAKHVPAVSIAFIDNGRIDWVRSYGLADVAGARSATPRTLFQAGSISKPVAATAAMAMVQDGELSLDQPVNARLKAWKIPDNQFTAKTPVTLRMLLTHTGGLTVHGFAGYEAGTPVPTVVQVLDGTAPANSDPIRVDMAPGTQWRYSGGGFTIAQLLMTEVSGKAFPDLLKARVLQPFGMADSTYQQPLPASRLAQAAVGYRPDDSAIPGLRNTYPEMAAAGLWTTPSDLARWVIAIEDADAGRSNPVLSQATTRQMLTPGLGKWGLGVEVAGAGRDRVFSHGGANEGFRNEMYGFPARRQGVVIMTNSDTGEAVMGPLLHAIADAYGWPGFETTLIKPAAPPAGGLAAFAGAYAVGSNVATVGETAGGRSLSFTIPNSSAFELIPQGGDTFVEAETAMSAKFLRDADGKVTGLDFDGVKLQRSPGS
jgi:CubicO group peptidase (beta-lactamase class C family)